jgi:hypothetical protein
LNAQYYVSKQQIKFLYRETSGNVRALICRTSETHGRLSPKDEIMILHIKAVTSNLSL